MWFENWITPKVLMPCGLTPQICRNFPRHFVFSEKKRNRPDDRTTGSHQIATKKQKKRKYTTTKETWPKEAKSCKCPAVTSVAGKKGFFCTKEQKGDLLCVWVGQKVRQYCSFKEIQSGQSGSLTDKSRHISGIQCFSGQVHLRSGRVRDTMKGSVSKWSERSWMVWKVLCLTRTDVHPRKPLFVWKQRIHFGYFHEAVLTTKSQMFSKLVCINCVSWIIQNHLRSLSAFYLRLQDSFSRF